MNHPNDPAQDTNPVESLARQRVRLLDARDMLSMHLRTDAAEIVERANRLAERRKTLAEYVTAIATIDKLLAAAAAPAKTDPAKATMATKPAASKGKAPK